MGQPTTPTLFGLTGEQLAGIRGYSDACAGLYRIAGLLDEYRCLAEFDGEYNRVAIRSIVQQARETENSLQAALKAETPFGTGARFAVAALSELRARTLEALTAAEREVL
jgi:hypothetical protein